MKRSVYAFLGLIALLVPAAPAVAQDQWVQQVRTLIRESGKRFEEEGYSLTHEIFTGSLNDDAKDTVNLDLSIGTEYYIVAACDTDCSDVDLVLYDPAGNEVDSDTLMDDFPIVQVTAPRSGTYSVHVSMATCSVNPCRYGVGAFGR